MSGTSTVFFIGLACQLYTIGFCVYLIRKNNRSIAHIKTTEKNFSDFAVSVGKTYQYLLDAHADGSLMGLSDKQVAAFGVYLAILRVTHPATNPIPSPQGCPGHWERS